MKTTWPPPVAFCLPPIAYCLLPACPHSAVYEMMGNNIFD